MVSSQGEFSSRLEGASWSLAGRALTFGFGFVMVVAKSSIRPWLSSLALKPDRGIPHFRKNHEKKQMRWCEKPNLTFFPWSELRQGPAESCCGYWWAIKPLLWPSWPSLSYHISNILKFRKCFLKWRFTQDMKHDWVFNDLKNGHGKPMQTQQLIQQI